MQYTLPSLALASVVSARALYPRDSSCCFGIQVSGSTVNGTLGQLSDGQNRIGPQGQSGATYCLDGSKITDSSGRGCVITSANQFQCDQGATPIGGFSLSSSGQINYRTNGTFWACPTDDNGDYNIYTDAISNMPKCVQVGLSSSNGACAASSGSSAIAAPVTASSSTAAAVSSIVTSSAVFSSVVAPVAPSSSVAALVASSIASATCEASTVVSTLPAQIQTVTQCITQQNNVSIPGPTQYKTQVSQTTDTAYQTETDTAYSTEEQTQTVAGPTSTVKTEEQRTTNWKTEEQTTTAYSTVTFNVTQSASPVTITVTQSATPITEVVTQSASPVTKEVTESATQYITQSANPTVNTTQYTSASAAPATLPTYSNSKSSASANISCCPGNLPDMSNYQAPHLIIPINSNSPNTTYGTQYNAYMGGGNSTIFNFDIPSNFTGKQCTVILTLPTNSQLDTSFVKSSGTGGIDFKQLVSPATEETSFANAPAVERGLGVQSVSVGDAYTVTSGECEVGALTYELSATGNLQLEYFQDYNLCQIGLWVYSS